MRTTLLSTALLLAACSTPPPDGSAPRLSAPSGLEQVVVEAFGLE